MSFDKHKPSQCPCDSYLTSKLRIFFPWLDEVSGQVFVSINKKPLVKVLCNISDICLFSDFAYFSALYPDSVTLPLPGSLCQTGKDETAALKAMHPQ